MRLSWQGWDALERLGGKHLQKGKKTHEGDFPGGLRLRICLATEGMTDSITGRGTKIPHASGQLGQHVTTVETAR